MKNVPLLNEKFRAGMTNWRAACGPISCLMQPCTCPTVYQNYNKLMICYKAIRILQEDPEEMCIKKVSIIQKSLS